MPGFIKTPKDEAKWEKAKKAAAKSTKHGSDGFWALSNYIYHKMGKTEEDTQQAQFYKKELLKSILADKSAELEKQEGHESGTNKVASGVSPRESFGNGRRFQSHSFSTMGNMTGGMMGGGMMRSEEKEEMPKEKMEKARVDEGKSPEDKGFERWKRSPKWQQKGVQRPMSDKKGVSETGYAVSIGDKKAAKELHQEKIKQLEEMPEPNLPKSEKMTKNSDPSVYKTPESFSEEEMYNAIRQDIMAEYDAISLYEAHKHASDNKELNEIFDHIIDEEKSHIKLLEDFLDKNDQLKSESMKKAMSVGDPRKKYGKGFLAGKNGELGTSYHGINTPATGECVREGDMNQEAKDEHKRVFKEMKSQPKPSLPKSEEMDKATNYEKGVHIPFDPEKPGSSHSGSAAQMATKLKNYGTKPQDSWMTEHNLREESKKGHKKVLQDIKDQPKPSLPKSEEMQKSVMAPKTARLTNVKITKKLPKPDDKPSVFFKKEEFSDVKKPSIENLRIFLENQRSKKDTKNNS
jgi:rubrerythrin